MARSQGAQEPQGAQESQTKPQAAPLNYFFRIHIALNGHDLVDESFNKRHNSASIMLDIQSMISLNTKKKQGAQRACKKAQEFWRHF